MADPTGLEQIGPDWVVDAYSPGDVHLWRRLETRVALQTPFQALEIARLETLGWCLLLDGKIQSSQLDDRLYHELLVHPALLAHPRPRRVLILGGGEGATLREVLRHPTVEEAVMVDLDGDVVRLCREHVPFYAEGAFGDPRATLVIGDAWCYLQEQAGRRRFDVVVADLTDPGPVGPASGLYTAAFYGAVRRCLSRSGVFVSQVGGLRYARERALAVDVAAALRPEFASVFGYGEFIATYDFVWLFLLATCARRLGPSSATASSSRRMITSGCSCWRRAPRGRARAGPCSSGARPRGGCSSATTASACISARSRCPGRRDNDAGCG